MLSASLQLLPMPAELAPGDHYEGFEIIGEVGAGSFARVYEARPSDAAGSVALEISREPVESEDVATRVLREARILELMTNPHVVRMFGQGVGEDGRWYMVMELLEGGDLDELHDFCAPMPTARACKLMLGACLGLEEAHQQGIVHRDLKPENLWLQPDGTCKVVDFGLARSWDPDSNLGITVTTEHTMVGTPHYTQPEQLGSKPLVPASDIYSLGVIFYELLSARMPLFPDEPYELVRERLLHEPLEWLSAHLERPLVPLHRYRDCRERLPERLIHLVHQMLQKQPERRPRSGGVVARELASILDEELARPSPRQRPSRRSWWRKWWPGGYL